MHYDADNFMVLQWINMEKRQIQHYRIQPHGNRIHIQSDLYVDVKIQCIVQRKEAPAISCRKTQTGDTGSNPVVLFEILIQKAMEF